MNFKKNKIEGFEEEEKVEEIEEEQEEEEEFEELERIQTRQQYKRKKKFKKIIEKIKSILRLIFIGFLLGLIYSNIFIYNYAKATKKEELCKVEVKEEAKEPVKEVNQEVTSEEPLDEVCYLDEVSCKIKKYADKYGVEWQLAVAISKHETGNYTSYAFNTLNNVGGLMYWDGTKSALQSFDSLEKGIEKFISNLKYNYYDMGLDTIEEIQPKYAPIGAANDSKGLNQYWVKGVTNYYKSLIGK